MKIKFFLLLILFTSPAFAADNPSGLPIPRFVSLKSKTGEVNARSGPGTNYPIKWVYTRNGLPVEVISEFGNWRRIKDFEGEDGWVLQSLLSGKRSAITIRDTVVYGNYEGERAVMRLSSGVQIHVKECREIQCEIAYDKISGWADRNNLWGIYQKEVFD